MGQANGVGRKTQKDRCFLKIDKNQGVRALTGLRRQQLWKNLGAVPDFGTINLQPDGGDQPSIVGFLAMHASAIGIKPFGIRVGTMSRPAGLTDASGA